MSKLPVWLWVGVGGFLGANARYATGLLSQRLFGTGFPYGTLAANLLGSFLLGFVLAFLAERALPFSHELRLAVAVGFLGAFTTFSTYQFESHALLDDGQWLLAFLNLFGSLAAGLVAVRLGLLLGRA
jgi:CrcB protein